MRETFLEFIAQHEGMDRAADDLLAGARSATPAELSARLRTLADLVYRHVAAEDAVMLHMDGAMLPSGLAGPWREGRADFLRLRTDWLVFLHGWTDAAIAADPAGFVAAARPTLTGLKQATHIETRAFYAAALQQGALVFGPRRIDAVWPVV